MSGSVNRVIILGNLGQDPEIRHTQDGTAVANLSVATSQTWKKDGERRERTEWHRCTLWRKLAEIADKHLQKGSKVYLEGAIETHKWQDQNGQDRYTTEIVLRGYDGKLVMLGDGKRQEDSNTGGGSSAPPPPNLDDDLPF